MSNELLAQSLSLAVHEIRTPLTVAAGYLRILVREQAGPISDKQRKMLEEAERACGRINTIVNEMSEMGKLEDGRVQVSRTTVDLTELASELANGMHPADDRDVRFEVRGTDQPVVVTGDRARLAATMTTLARAALRDRWEPGVVVATVTTVNDTPTPWAVFAVGGHEIIPTLIEQARNAPDAFDEWREGLGLALPVSRRVIEALDGAIWSAPGDRPRAGSALRLPLHR